MKMNLLKLDDVADVIAGQSPESKYYNNEGEGYPFLQGKTDFGELNPKAKTWCTKPKKLSQENDILLSVRAPVGAVNIADTAFCIGRGICAIRTKKDYWYKYLYYYLQGHEYQIQRFQTGSTFKSITVAKIKQLKINFPEDKDDQIKIANLLTQVESLIAKREESIQLLDELLRSTFLDMFGDPVLNPKGWDVESLKKFGKISTGNTPSRREDKYYDSEYIEWIKTDNIKTDKVYLTKAKEYLSEKGLEKGRSVNAGSLLVTCIAGSLKSIGNASLTDRKVAFNQQINAIEPFEDVNSFFLYWLVKISKKYIQNQAGKGMKKMITKSSFEKITFPKPPKPLQDKFATIVQQVEETKKNCNESLDELHQLFGSLSQRAFKGELDFFWLSGSMDNVFINESQVAPTWQKGLSAEMQEFDLTKGDYVACELKRSRESQKLLREREKLSIKMEKWKNASDLAMTIREISFTSQVFRSLNIPSFKIDAFPFHTQVHCPDIHSFKIFQTASQLMKLMKKRKEYISQILKDIPLISESINNDLLCKEDFLDATLKYDYGYGQIKRIIMDKLASNELAQKFDEESKSIKLVKAT